MKFAGLKIGGWRQFEEIDIKFSPRVTIITGANGAGKSTILRILGQHFGWNSQMLRTPVVESGGITKYFSGIFNRRPKLAPQPPPSATQDEIGTVSYSNSGVGQIVIPRDGSVQYNIQIVNRNPIDGLFIQSHRPVQNYQQVNHIPTNVVAAEQAYQQYRGELVNRYNNGHSQFGPIYRMKEALISMATFGPGNQNVAGNPETERLYKGFEEVLRKVLPKDLGFRHLSVRIPDVVMATNTGDFVVDAASGGLMSLVDLAWQIFLYSRDREEFVVIIDEPENHLHPSMQRTIIESMISAFPQAQFVIATHSPFIVSSVRDAAVYVLRYNVVVDEEIGPVRHRTVSSVLLDQVSKAGTASDILRDALGVPVTIPIWAEAEIRNIAADFSINNLTEESLDSLKVRLAAAGLSEFYPDAVRQVAKNQ